MQQSFDESVAVVTRPAGVKQLNCSNEKVRPQTLLHLSLREEQAQNGALLFNPLL
ncbi:MAG: hypothetical protein H0X73_04470 [Chthoniobacterales bacterium]|nr:hypothetical protein [Chthoniobacterales bacterium]